MQEKIKVNLSYNVYHLLQKDMDDFNFHVKDGTPNKNLFYNTIIKNMVSQYRNEMENVRDKLSLILDKHISSRTVFNDILNEIETLYNYTIEDKTNRSHGYYISFRPSKKQEELYEEIEMYELKNTTISNYFRNIFNKYAKLSQDERERIVFKDELSIIESAIQSKKILKITVNKRSFELYPYVIVRTNDELYNYVIGAIKTNNNFHCVSLHLFKCVDMIKTKNKFEFNEKEIKQLNENLTFGPREIERRTVLSKIKLTPKGIKKFKAMYLNRPIPVEIKDDIYTFNCSHQNLFTYFSRFGVDAMILEPLNLRNQMIAFHKKAFNKYINK